MPPDPSFSDPTRMNQNGSPAEGCGCSSNPPGNEPPSGGRRRFLQRASAGIAAAAALLAGVPLIGFLFSPVLRREGERWRAIGDVDIFPVGETVMVRYRNPDPLPWAGYAGRSAAWLRRDSARSFTAFSMYCTHAGCPVTWAGGAEMFMCPCHGGVFYRDGSVAAGPPQRPLERLPVRIRAGQVEIRTLGAPLPG